MRKITDKIDRVVHIDDRYKAATLPPPIAVKIELTRSCNYRCEFCYHSQLDKSAGHMDFDLYKSIIDQLKSIGVQEVAPFFFGESFLNPQLPQAIEYAKQVGFEYIFLTTNGSLANEKKVYECMKAGLNSLKFSLNYSDEKQFRETTNVSGKYYNRVIDNIKSARKIRDDNNFDCGLYASYILYDAEQQQRMEKLLEIVKPYLDEVYALPLYNQAYTIKDKEDWTFSGGNQGRADNAVSPVPCWALFREGHINYDGTVCACCFSVSDKFIMGDLKQQSFMEIWNSEKFVQLRQAHLNNDIRGTVCEGCITQKISGKEGA